MYAVMYKITIVNTRIYPEYLFFNLILSSQKNQDSLCNIWRFEKKKYLCSDSIYKKYIFYEKSNYHKNFGFFV